MPLRAERERIGRPEKKTAAQLPRSVLCNSRLRVKSRMPTASDICGKSLFPFGSGRTKWHIMESLCAFLYKTIGQVVVNTWKRHKKLCLTAVFETIS